MISVWTLTALWLGPTLIQSLFSIWLRISTVLSEIVVSTIAQLFINAAIDGAVLCTMTAKIRRYRPRSRLAEW